MKLTDILTQKHIGKFAKEEYPGDRYPYLKDIGGVEWKEGYTGWEPIVKSEDGKEYLTKLPEIGVLWDIMLRWCQDSGFATDPDFAELSSAFNYAADKIAQGKANGWPDHNTRWQYFWEALDEGLHILEEYVYENQDRLTHLKSGVKALNVVREVGRTPPADWRKWQQR